jgi:osmotically-inducible protein OsmY
MNPRQKKILAVAGAVALAVVAAISMIYRHGSEKSAVAPMRAQMSAAEMSDAAITAAIERAGVSVASLSVRNVGGIVVLRGSADLASAEKAAETVKGLGFTRVANLIRPLTFDDDNIRRNAERQLAQTRALDGCTLKVSCTRGVISLTGTVRSELQADAARLVLRGVSGAHEVRVDLNKM